MRRSRIPSWMCASRKGIVHDAAAMRLRVMVPLRDNEQLTLPRKSRMPTVLPPRPLATDPETALNLLIEGNARHVADTPRERFFSDGRDSRALGQAPFAAILGCADSRVSPEAAFEQGPGNLFVVRVVGNFVTDEVLASLEFSASVLGIKLILVLGHTGCGGVQS